MSGSSVDATTSLGGLTPVTDTKRRGGEVVDMKL